MILCATFDRRIIMTQFSILDLAPIKQGSNATEALQNCLDLAQHAEVFGFERFWVAEHHNMQGIASAATAVVIGHVANGTSRIRIGSGGIMLPNHSPLVIAEQFGTLASLYPDRIDLGLGRAPGTDQITSHALRRTLNGSAEDFPRDVIELQQYFAEPEEGQKVMAVPGAGTHVPLWILGSSLFGAQLAAMLGLPFAFASHFAPAQMLQAIELYREGFKPSAQLAQPYLMMGYNICAGESLEEAEYLRTSSLQSFLNLRRGKPSQLPPPIKNFEKQLTREDEMLLSQMGRCSAIGALPEIKSEMAEFISLTGADELILTSSIYDHSKRLRSFEIAAEAGHSIK